MHIVPAADLTSKILVLAVFALTYGLIILFYRHKMVVVWTGVTVLLIVRKHGHSVRPTEFLRIGLPFSIISALASTLFAWLVFYSS
jgi:hypothetical protein